MKLLRYLEVGWLISSPACGSELEAPYDIFEALIARFEGSIGLLDCSMLAWLA